MLTRLRVNGFKNLVDVDVRFGPFTCIAGPNGAGKSNLFDAIRFLSSLASKTLMESALSVRNEEARNADIRSIFHRVHGHSSNRMSFEAEMIVPQEAVDDLGQPGKATANFLRYTLELEYRKNTDDLPSPKGPIEILKEELVHIPLGQAGNNLPFQHSAKKWRNSALKIKHRTGSFISTVGDGENRIINLHQDGGSRGPAKSNPATQPRTVLSVANAAESPTVLCAKREMESWKLLQLEPSDLRKPDDINSSFHLETTGLHLPATLYHLAKGWSADSEHGKSGDPEHAYCQIANRLNELIDDVHEVLVDRDDKRELLTLMVKGKDGTPFAARSLSDGTLRFLALAVLEMDPKAQGVICLEEPENGIHPERIPAMLDLLRDIATDTDEPVDGTNPLRQIIVNTHSPAVVLTVPDDTLLVVEAKEDVRGESRFTKAVFGYLAGTWREEADGPKWVIPKGRLLSYLNPVSPGDEGLNRFYEQVGRNTVSAKTKPRPRIADRQDFQRFLPFVDREINDG